MIPGSRAIRAGLILGVSALLVPFFPELIPVLAGAFGLIFVAMLLELFILRRVTVTMDRPENVAFSVNELEKYQIRVFTSADFILIVYLRQRWPELLEQRSSIREGICRPGEVLKFDFEVHAIADG